MEEAEECVCVCGSLISGASCLLKLPCFTNKPTLRTFTLLNAKRRRRSGNLRAAESMTVMRFTNVDKKNAIFFLVSKNQSMNKGSVLLQIALNCFRRVPHHKDDKKKASSAPDLTTPENPNAIQKFGAL